MEQLRDVNSGAFCLDSSRNVLLCKDSLAFMKIKVLNAYLCFGFRNLGS